MGYSNKLTEEEEMLQKKFAKLRKKKKAIQQLRQSKSNPQTPTTPQPTATKRAAETSKEDARELAKKILAAQQAKQTKQENKEKGFKRSRNLEKRLRDPDKSSGAPAYQPFNASGSSPRGSDDHSSSSGGDMKKHKGLYDRFVSKGTLEDEKRESNQEMSFSGRKRGNTIYVYCPKINQELCKETFSKFGSIANISLEPDRNCAFITFDALDAADNAIEAMNGNMVKGMTLKVALARRQPSLEAVQNNTNSPWTKLAGGITKTRHKDQREVVVYDNTFE
ncbi:negative elongation factor E-like [Diadema setosum]|uniref:negative elongation factor E-like n=1 Tax=Diadema setosum TaxID=31175 RepID=UPI003B3A326C